MATRVKKHGEDNFPAGSHEIKIIGKYCAVKAKLKHLESLSAHVDQVEILSWLKEIKNIAEKGFLTHGEPPTALDALRVKIKDKFQGPGS